MRLEAYITELLKEHNCVIVPEFGGFVANYKPAFIDEGKGKIFPPSKSVLFNPNLINNDGLLIHEVSIDQNLSYPDATSWVNVKVNDWKEKLEEGDRVELEELGFLYQQNGTIRFEQSRELNLLLSAYGLSAIDFVLFASEKITKAPESSQNVEPAPKVEKLQPTVEIEHEAEVKTVVEEVETEIDVFNIETAVEILPKKNDEAESEVIPIQRNRFKTVMKYAAAVVIVPCLFYSYWIPMETDALDTGAIQLSDFNPVHSQVKKSYRPRTESTEFGEIVKSESWENLTEHIQANTYNFELAEDFYIPVSLEKKESTDVDQTDTQIEADEMSVNNVHGNYQVITGCFSVKSNANKLVADLKDAGFSATIFDQKGGLHRVTAGGFDNRNQAKNALENVKSQGFSAWILKD